MKRALIFAIVLGFCLGGCAKTEVWYMVPQLEFADGEVPTMLSFPSSSLDKCEAIGHQFDSDVGADPAVLSHSWSCIASAMRLKKPTTDVPHDEPLVKKNSV